MSPLPHTVGEEGDSALWPWGLGEAQPVAPRRASASARPSLPTSFSLLLPRAPAAPAPAMRTFFYLPEHSTHFYQGPLHMPFLSGELVPSISRPESPFLITAPTVTHPLLSTCLPTLTLCGLHPRSRRGLHPRTPSPAAVH